MRSGACESLCLTNMMVQSEIVKCILYDKVVYQINLREENNLSQKKMRSYQKGQVCGRHLHMNSVKLIFINMILF